MAADSWFSYVNNLSVYLGKEANAPCNKSLGYDVVKNTKSLFLEI